MDLFDGSCRSTQPQSVQSSSVDASLMNQSTPQSSGVTASGEAEDSEGEMPEMDVYPLNGDNGDSICQNVETNTSTVQDLSAITIVPGEGESEQSGTYDQDSNISQNSIQVGESVREQSEEVHSSNHTKKSTDNGNDPDYSESDSKRPKYGGRRSKDTMEKILKRADAKSGLDITSLSGKERRLLNLRNSGVAYRKQLREKARETKRMKTSST